MFDSLKKKLKAWLGKPEAEEKSKAKKTAKAPKAKKEKPTKKQKTSKKIPSEKKLKEIAETIKEEIPQKFETGQLQYQPDAEAIQEKISEEIVEEKIEAKQEEPKKEKGFFAKLFGKKEKPIEEISEEKIAKEERIISEEKKVAEEKRELKEPIPEEKPQGFFSKLSAKFTTSTITQEQVEEIFQELEIILLENNVALKVVDKIKENLIKDLVGIEVKKRKIEETIIQSLKE